MPRRARAALRRAHRIVHTQLCDREVCRLLCGFCGPGARRLLGYMVKCPYGRQKAEAASCRARSETGERIERRACTHPCGHSQDAQRHGRPEGRVRPGGQMAHNVHAPGEAMGVTCEEEERSRTVCCWLLVTIQGRVESEWCQREQSVWSCQVQNLRRIGCS